MILFQEQFFDTREVGTDYSIDPFYFARIGRPTGNSGGSGSSGGGASSAEVEALKQEINRLKNTINTQNTTITNLQTIVNNQGDNITNITTNINEITDRVETIEETPATGMHVELTQAEYDALSDEDKMKDIEYFVSG